ncbi:MAG: YraN family protein [Planctomycetota bacterium]|jgi:putative endonuclease
MRRLLRRLRGEQATGPRGERLAARWRRRRGYRILARNLKLGDDEADLVVLDPDRRTVALVEVKTRSAAMPPPEASIDARKQRRLARLAARLQKRRAYADRPIRFDAIAIVWPDGRAAEVRHYVGAFESPF